MVTGIKCTPSCRWLPSSHFFVFLLSLIFVGGHGIHVWLGDCPVKAVKHKCQLGRA
jgi:hypothetical protein